VSSPAEPFGPYLVYEQLGIGGMASVHRAEARGIEGFRRTVALKRMLSHCAADPSLVKSFVHEARLASHLRHENVAQTYELGKVGDIYFIAMELVQGRTLRTILKHCAKTTGPMPVPIALNILNQLCDALDYAHNLCDETGQPLGIIHRDVSPSNIIISDGSGVLKLIDFGIAKARNSGMQTMSGVVKGKFSYMAPEYIDGHLDARADLFAVGVIAHELLTNHPLFGGADDLDTLMRVKNMPIEPPSYVNPEVPREVDEIVMTALQRDPDRRWQQATALRTAMTTVTKRLGFVTHNAQVFDWLSWAFEQQVRSEDSDPEISVSRNTVTGSRIKGAAGAPEPSPAASGPITKIETPEFDAAKTLARPQRVSHQQPVQYYRPTQPQAMSSQQMAAQRVSEQLVAQQRTSDQHAAQQRISEQLTAFNPASEHLPVQAMATPAPDRPRRTGGGTASPPRSGRGVLIAVLLLVAAAGTAAVVYFGLPFFT
jgi:serine/threonine protein kinase